MSVEIKIPSIGESITEVTLASWQKNDGDYVEEGDILCEIESDKATVELPAESSGVLKITAQEGDELEIGAVIGTLEEGDAPKKSESKEEAPKKEEPQEPESGPGEKAETSKSIPSPAAKKILDEKGVDPSSVKGSGKEGRITKGDALEARAQATPTQEAGTVSRSPSVLPGGREVRREKMSRLRKTIAKRLVEAKNSTAMLTTFNEVDMFEVMELRKRYKESFKEKHGVGLGFMSFFTKACCQALKDVPAVNAQIEGEELLFHEYVDMGIAVSTPKGLVVPIIRNAESLGLAEIESSIIELATKARDGKITIDEMQGGTFTITNGGIFGSMLSTPIINIPQSAILGMHNIVQRPTAVNGEVLIRPIMYLALSYDHRIIDGRESVTFLKKVKEYLEDPARLLLDV